MLLIFIGFFVDSLHLTVAFDHHASTTRVEVLLLLGLDRALDPVSLGAGKGVNQVDFFKLASSNPLFVALDLGVTTSCFLFHIFI